MTSMLERVVYNVSAVVLWMLIVSSGMAAAQADVPASGDGTRPSGFAQPNVQDAHEVRPFGDRYMPIRVYGAAQNSMTKEVNDDVYLYEPPLRFRIVDDGTVDVRNYSDPPRVVFYLEGMNQALEDRIHQELLLKEEIGEVLPRNIRPLQYSSITLSDVSGQKLISRYPPEDDESLPAPQDWIRFEFNFTGHEDGVRLASEFANRLRTEEVEFSVVLEYGGRRLVQNSVELTTQRLLKTDFYADLEGDGSPRYVARSQIRQALAAAHTDIQSRVYREDPSATVPSLEWPEHIWKRETMTWEDFLSRYDTEVSKYGFDPDDLKPDIFTRFVDHVKSEMENERKDHIDIRANMKAGAKVFGLGGDVSGSTRVSKEEFERVMRSNENRVEWDGNVFRPRTIDMFIMDESALENENRIASYVITTRPGTERFTRIISSQQGRSAASPTGGGLFVADTGSNVCTAPPNGMDVFSVGEVRTSILEPTPFQELNGSEWVLMDGRSLSERTDLSRHLSENERDRTVPDARGRFLRMANNDACADHREKKEGYHQCIADHDPDGDDRPLGTYQADSFGSHQHTYNDVYYSENIAALRRDSNGYLPPGTSFVDLHNDGRRSNNVGNAGPADNDNDGVGFDRKTENAGNGETRSKNVAVNFYIKICNCRTGNCR